MRDIRLQKPTPRVVEKTQRKRAIEQHRKRIRALVFARDKGKCRVCGGLAHEMHELRYRSLMGSVSLENSIAVCNYQGNSCHRLLQTHAIDVIGTDANKRLEFRCKYGPVGLSRKATT